MFRLLVLCLVLCVPAAAEASGARKLDVRVRGKTLGISLYRPAGAARGTIIMGSGDVGWVGLAVSMAEEFSGRGFIVAGVNVRQYLSTFTDGTSHLSTSDVGRDYAAIAAALKSDGSYVPPIIVSGVSEGAGLAVLAAADPSNHEWLDGIVTMGLPEIVELAWRWSDITAWITKRDADEPSFGSHGWVAAIAPLPFAMIQSTKDEYVPESDYRRIYEAARDPKKLMLIDASNHRFTDRQPELKAAFAAALDWVLTARAAGSTK